MNLPDHINLSSLGFKVKYKEQPKCFGAYPISNPVEQAENCCHDCPYNHSCFEKMAQDNPPPWME